MNQQEKLIKHFLTNIYAISDRNINLEQTPFANVLPKAIFPMKNISPYREFSDHDTFSISIIYYLKYLILKKKIYEAKCVHKHIWFKRWLHHIPIEIKVRLHLLNESKIKDSFQKKLPSNYEWITTYFEKQKDQIFQANVLMTLLTENIIVLLTECPICSIRFPVSIEQKIVDSGEKFLCPICLAQLVFSKKKLYQSAKDFFLSELQGIPKNKSETFDQNTAQHILNIACRLNKLITIRFGVFRVDAAHIISNTLVFSSFKEIGFDDSNTLDIIWPETDWKPWNTFAFELNMRFFKYTHPIARAIVKRLPVNHPKNLLRKLLHPPYTGIFFLTKKSMKVYKRIASDFFTFTDKEIQSAQQKLKEMGIPSGAKYACVIFRSRKFHQDFSVKEYSRGYGNYNETTVNRNANFDSVKFTIKALSDRGYYVLLMGKESPPEELIFEYDKYILYSKNHRSDFLDIYLFMHSDILVGLGGSQVFTFGHCRNNCLALDLPDFWVPEAVYNMTLSLPKHIYSKPEKRLLGVEERIVSKPTNHAKKAAFFKDQIVNNSFEDIERTIDEFLEIINEKKEYTNEYDYMHKAFYSNYQFIPFSYQVDYNGGRIASAYLDKYRDELLSMPIIEPKDLNIQQNHEENEKSLKNITSPKISFITIVLNGMPFIEFVLNSIYQYAHEIIIVEGAVENCMFAANPDGSSVDGTVELIKHFPDPSKKIRLIQGKWPEKCQMQNKALEYITGDYIWLIDSDEIYRNKDIESILNILQENPTITQINFIPDNFFKGFNYIFVSPKFFDSQAHYRRIFKYTQGAYFSTHRPPTLIWPENNTSTEQMNLIDGTKTREMGIIPNHYSYVYNSQVEQKITLYHKYGWGKSWGINLSDWYTNFFQKWNIHNRQELEKKYPIWTGDANSYSVPYNKSHPKVVRDFLKKQSDYNEDAKYLNEIEQAVQDVLYSFITVPFIQCIEIESNITDEIAKDLGHRGQLISLHESKTSLSFSKQLCIGLKNIHWHQYSLNAYLDTDSTSNYYFVYIGKTHAIDALDILCSIISFVHDKGIILLHNKPTIRNSLIQSNIEFSGHTYLNIVCNSTNRKQIKKLKTNQPFGTFYSQNKIIPSEESLLNVIGSEKYLRLTLMAWKHIHLDEPLKGRYQAIDSHLKHGTSFWNIHVGLAFLADRLQPESYLEVGVRTAGSLVQVLACKQLLNAIGIDKWKGNYANYLNTPQNAIQQVQLFLNNTNSKCSVKFIQGNSHVELKKLIQQGYKFDLITIDGDHSDEGAFEDLQDAYQLLNDKGAIVFDDIIHSSFKTLLNVVLSFAKQYNDLQLLLNTTQDNGTAIILRNLSWNDIAHKGHIAGKGEKSKDLTQIQKDSTFEKLLLELIKTIRPQRIIETGTYKGEGTTKMIASALRDVNINHLEFYTIECNPENYKAAIVNLSNAQLLYFVKPLLGLSMPRSMLPSKQEIFESTILGIDSDEIFVDHEEFDRVKKYYEETNFKTLPDDLIRFCLQEMKFQPHLIVLDSAGHIGNIEFNYIINKLKSECYIVIDDTKHIKHYKSYQQIQKDDRFTVLYASDEKFGFCFALFNPIKQPDYSVKRLVWVRTDSIGDNIIAMSLLPHISSIYPNAKITVLCQDHIAELYENCPLVDKMITFNREKALHDTNYQAQIQYQLKEENAEVTLNTVFSREEITDLFSMATGSKQKIAFHGNLCNISQRRRLHNNIYYSKIVHSDEKHIIEIKRYEDFLKAIGIPDQKPTTQFWLSTQDKQFAHNLLKNNGFVPEKTIVLFSGAQSEYRSYERYGESLVNICKANDFQVVAIGSESDKEINQRNLDHVPTHKMNLSGLLTLRQSAAIIESCRLAVGGETGLAHIACAVKTPNVILLGGGHYGRFMPYSNLTSIACLPLDCYYCNWKCKYTETHCVKNLDPIVISMAIVETLKKMENKIRIFTQTHFQVDTGKICPKICSPLHFLNPDDVTMISIMKE